MSDEFRHAYTTLSGWADDARRAGWLSMRDLDAIKGIEQASPDDLFLATQRRPLVIGLFGGTGVGKSSLLNRLAGEAIARVGVERPTSREVTLYLHESHDLASLPDEFPVDSTRTTRHRDDAKKDIAWLDMPDIDSTEAANRALVFAWLPYIDWLVYVVSPERYRDDAGWQVLRNRGHRHRWLFIMNQWDLGAQEQVDELRHDLEQAGFPDPTILTTVCTDAAADDEFDRLQRTILDAIDAHGLAELQRLGILAKLRDINQLANQFKQRFGDEPAWKEFVGTHRNHVRETVAQLQTSLQWPIENIANRYRHRRHAMFNRPDVPDSVPELSELHATLWSDQSQLYIDDVVTQGAVDAERRGIATDAIERVMENTLRDAGERLSNAAQTNLALALARPGTPLQRGVRAALRALLYALPLAAAGWTVYHTTVGYRRAVQGQQSFLGVDFAVHSLLLIFLAWLIPFLLHRLLRPSLRASARKGLQRGVASACQQILSQLGQAYATLSHDRQALLKALPEASLTGPTKPGTMSGS